MGTPGMLAALANIPEQLAGSIDNLFLAGDYMGIPSVNGALFSGERAATQVADRLAPTSGSAPCGPSARFRACRCARPA